MGSWNCFRNSRKILFELGFVSFESWSREHEITFDEQLTDYYLSYRKDVTENGISLLIANRHFQPF